MQFCTRTSVCCFQYLLKWKKAWNVHSSGYCLFNPHENESQLQCIQTWCFVYISEFVSTPTSVNVTVGSTATFNCSVTTGVVFWLVNGSQLSELLILDIKARQVGRTFFLNVPATVEYNNTVVICMLVVFGRDDLYCDEVILMVQGTCV